MNKVSVSNLQMAKEQTNKKSARFPLKSHCAESIGLDHLLFTRSYT